MADKILNTRILLKQAELSAWDNSTLPLKKGEVVFATVAATAGNELAEPVVMAKVCTEEGKIFKELPWAFYAKAADVYGWAKAEKKPVYTADEIEGLENFIAGEIQDTNTTYSFAIVDGKLVVTPSEGTATTLDLVTPDELTTALGNYVTTAAFGEFQTANTQAIANAKAGAEATAASALATARTEISAEIDADVKELADGAVKTAQDRADAAYALAETKANASTTYNKTEVDNLVAPLATSEALGEVRDTANEAKTKIDTFLGTITPDGSADIIDTLAEINQYVTSDTEAFAELSNRVGILEGKPGLEKVGTVTSITAGDGLAGGTITETGTIALSAATKASLAKADTALQDADAFDAAGSAAQALTDAKKYTDDEIAELDLANTYEPIGAEARAKAYADGLAGNYDAAGAADAALEAAKKYADDNDADTKYTAAVDGGLKLNGTEFAIDDSITFIFDCGGAE